VSTLCDFAFRELDINRIQIKCAVTNSASRNIPHRLGFQLEGIERAGELLTGGVFTDLAVYSKLKGDG
ncbi:MAG: GNAT family protein, partial [Candidatus Paceibacterota bacterium]|jgi:ribosomal-protein-serine acetyltransferase